MSDRLERDARWIRLAIWTAVLVVLAVTGAVTANFIQRKQAADHREDAASVRPKAPSPAPAPAAPEPVDFESYEKANAARNQAQLAKENAAYDAYRSARKPTDEATLRRLPEPRKP